MVRQKFIMFVLAMTFFLPLAFAQEDMLGLEMPQLSPVMEDLSTEMERKSFSKESSDLSRQEEVPPYLQDELEAVVEKPVAYEETVPLGPTILRMLAALSLVLVLLFVILLVVKKFGPYSTVASKSMINVIEHSALAPGKSLHLVSVGSELLLLASDSNGIVFIKSVNPLEQGYSVSGPAEIPASGFKKTLAAKVKGFKPEEAIKKDFVVGQDADIQSNIHDIHAQIEKLKKMKSDLNEIT